MRKILTIAGLIIVAALALQTWQWWRDRQNRDIGAAEADQKIAKAEAAKAESVSVAARASTAKIDTVLVPKLIKARALVDTILRVDTFLVHDTVRVKEALRTCSDALLLCSYFRDSANKRFAADSTTIDKKNKTIEKDSILLNKHKPRRRCGLGIAGPLDTQGKLAIAGPFSCNL